MDSLPIVVGNTHKEKKNEAKQMKMKSLYIKVITNLNNLHLCLIFFPQNNEKQKRKTPKQIKSEKRLEKNKKTPQLHIPRENLTAG